MGTRNLLETLSLYERYLLFAHHRRIYNNEIWDKVPTFQQSMSRTLI
jgi:hypothetical protein